MTDTQWPRWEVFKQDSSNKPHQSVGSVHAADAEHALLNARDVFARRPKAVSMWVAPADTIFSLINKEWTENPNWYEEMVDSDSPLQSFTLFRKANQRHSMTFVDYVGEVEATTPKQALQQAMTQFDDKPAFAWWVVPTQAIARSDADAVDSWFAPAATKTYKQQSAYGLVSSRRKGKRG